MNDFLDLYGYVDSILILDKNYTITYTARYNPRFEEDVFNSMYTDYINKNFFEVYNDIKIEESSVFKCMNSGKVIKKYNQTFKDFKGRLFNTNNISIPIIKKGEIVGVIELSKDITSINDLNQENIKKATTEMKKDKVKSENTFEFDDILTNNEEMISNVRKAKVFSLSKKPTLIYGETGTGKELFVHSMYNNSMLYKRSFIALNCAALPENLFESMLFGSVKGSYTGAENKIGLLEQADGGTLFLDELNSMPLSIQAKLLRVIQDGVVRPIGSSKEKKVSVKIIGAMNIDPMEAIDKKIIREDLFYRFSSSTIRLVPLRERKSDILFYANYFLEQFNEEYNKNIKSFSKRLLEIFVEYEWKGNVRELKHIIESLVSLNDNDILEVDNLPIYMKKNVQKNACEETEENEWKHQKFISLTEATKKMEIELIINAMVYTRGNVTRSAEMLDIPRQTLKYKLDKYKIKSRDYK